MLQLYKVLGCVLLKVTNLQMQKKTSEKVAFNSLFHFMTFLYFIKDAWGSIRIGRLHIKRGTQNNLSFADRSADPLITLQAHCPI